MGDKRVGDAVKLSGVDARVKLFMLLGVSTASVLSREWRLLACLLALTVCVLAVGGVSLGRTLWRVRGALGLMASLFILQCIFNRTGEPLLCAGGLVLVRRGGVETALAVLLRLLIMLLAALMVLTGEKRDYLLALRQLGLPYEVCFMVMAGLHFLPTLRNEAQDVLCAVQMRGTRVHGAPLRRRLGVYMRVALPIVAGAIRRSEQLSVAMEARAFRSMPGRSSMRRLRMQRHDFVWLAGFFAALAGSVAAYFLLWR